MEEWIKSLVKHQYKDGCYAFSDYMRMVGIVYVENIDPSTFY